MKKIKIGIDHILFIIGVVCFIIAVYHAKGHYQKNAEKQSSKSTVFKLNK